MKKISSIIAVALFASIGFSSSVSAQTTTSSPTCADATWSEALLQAVPNIDTHCLEIVQRDGNYFAKVQARIVRQGARSTVVRFRQPDGSWSTSERAHPPRGFRADIAGRDVAVSQLAAGQEVNIYYGPQSPNTFTLASYQDAAPQEVEPMEVAVMEEPAPEPEPAAEPAMLPTTAGQTGWLAILGALLLLSGVVARVASKRV